MTTRDGGGAGAASAARGPDRRWADKVELAIAESGFASDNKFCAVADQYVPPGVPRLSQPNLSRVLRGKRDGDPLGVGKPHPIWLWAIARVAGVRLEWMLDPHSPLDAPSRKLDAPEWPDAADWDAVRRAVEAIGPVEALRRLLQPPGAPPAQPPPAAGRPGPQVKRPGRG